MYHTCLTALESSSQVGVYHSLPAFWGNVLCWAAELSPTIIHQEVYPAVLLQNWWHKFLHLTDTRESNHDTIVVVGANKVKTFGGRLWKNRTSFSFRMLHWKGVTDAGLEGGSFCLISWAAASSRPVFRLEMITLQPKEKNMCAMQYTVTPLFKPLNWEF